MNRILCRQSRASAHRLRFAVIGVILVATAALAAPAIGFAILVLGAFAVSRAGLPLDKAAAPLVATLGALALLSLAIRRPRQVPWLYVAGFAVLCVPAALLVGAPMQDFGWHWLANGNDDMTNYVLSAARLLESGISDPLDVEAFVAGRDYAEAFEAFHSAGVRPGSDQGWWRERRTIRRSG